MARIPAPISTCRHQILCSIAAAEVWVMGVKRFILIAVMAAVTSGSGAETISGSITIKKRLTHRSVTPAVSVYQRGVAVKLGKDPEQDPIAFELSRVVIYLEGPDLAGNPLLAAERVQITQLDRRFTPNLVVIPVGATVSFPNMDPIFHNVFSLSKAKSFDLGSYDKGDTRKVTFPKPGIVDVYCHLHPNMEATIVVTPNRWYAQPGPLGQYQIENVPPGHYTVVAWHKAAGFFRKAILIESGHDATADFLIPIEDLRSAAATP
jgi:plastocyanin